MKRNFQNILDRANAAGILAGKSVETDPMIVRDGKNIYKIDDGVCGFAWVNIFPAHCSFAKWLKENNIGHRDFKRGWNIWVHEHNQSMQRKTAHAEAMAKVLQAEGFKCMVFSRMD